MLVLSLRLSLLLGFAAPAWIWGSTSTTDVATSHEDAPVARTVGRVPVRERQQLKWAMALAVQRLRERPACRQLFAALGADGLARLAATFYTAPISTAELRTCRRKASAMTSVGCPRTIICSPSFGQLTRRRAAVTLLHEALHHAGLSEYPHEPGALRSAEINHLVKVSCGL